MWELVVELELVTPVVNVEIAECLAQLHTQPEEAAFPAFVENGFVGFGLHRAEAVHAAHVMHAVHFAVAFAVPIIASRVMSAASSASLIFSVPAGRSGMTR